MMVDAKYRTRSSRQIRRKDEMMGIQFAQDVKPSSAFDSSFA